MADTRWWLARGAHGLIFLHVAEIGGRERGYAISITDRHLAREYLSTLREHLAEAIARQDRPTKTFDAVEAPAPAGLRRLTDAEADRFGADARAELAKWTGGGA